MTQSPLKNDTLLRALHQQPTEYTPIWLMRQAGRYLPEYNATRKKAGDFLALARNPDFATEITLQPLNRFALDAAIIFSDILLIPDAMGLELSFETGHGPIFNKPLQQEEAITHLSVPDMEKLNDVFDAIKKAKTALAARVPLIGFSGSPWTLACYMIEGKSSTDFHAAKKMMYQRPDLMHKILEINTQAIVEYLKQQIEAGVDVLMIFDTWGGILPPSHFSAFSADYIKRILVRLQHYRTADAIPKIIYSKCGNRLLKWALQQQIPAEAIGLDWTVDIGTAREQAATRYALQGNLDPALLLGSEATLRSQTRALLDRFGSNPGHVFNLGHGISQYTPIEQVQVLIDEVHHYSAALKNRSPA